MCKKERWDHWTTKDGSPADAIHIDPSSGSGVDYISYHSNKNNGGEEIFHEHYVDGTDTIFTREEVKTCIFGIEDNENEKTEDEDDD